jgi:membrane-associated phospholipid phosphatase
MSPPELPRAARPPPLAPQSAGAQRRSGLRDILPRVLTRFWLKTFGVSAVIWLFFIGYFHLLRHPRHEPFVMPLTALDAAVPFAPAALWVYLSLWIYVGIAPGMLLSLRELLRYGAWAAALCLTGLALFYIVPTAVPPPAVPIDVSQHRAFAVLQGVDAAGNACPSMHVASAVFTALWIARLLGEMRARHWLQVTNAAWLLLIVYSTIATRQHVVLDVVAGAALGALFAALSLADRGRPQRHPHRVTPGSGR